MNAITLTTPAQSLDLTLLFDGIASDNSIRAYAYQMRGFQEWMNETGTSRFDRNAVKRWKAMMTKEGFAASTINQGLTVIRSLAREALISGAIDRDALLGIESVKSVRSAGRRTGYWMSQTQAQRLLEIMRRDKSLSGMRDLAIIALMLGTGLRRDEVSRLTTDNVQRHATGKMIMQIIGKGNKVRTIPIPQFSLNYLTTWATAAQIKNGLIFRAITKSDKLAGPVKTHSGKMTNGGLSPSSIYKIVKRTGKLIAVDLDPHDLRRTCAQLMHKSGAKIDQIQQILGHSSIRITELYLGLDIDVAHAATDLIPLK